MIPASATSDRIIPHAKRSRSLRDISKANGLGRDKALDLRDRMRRQFLGDLGGYAADDLRVKRPAKISEYFWRRDDHQRFETVGVHMPIECLGKLAGKAFFCKVVPIDFLHSGPGDAQA